MAELTTSPVICVDGPGGAGKGTLAAALAEKLGWHCLDSGAIYRVVTAAALARKVDLDNEAALARLAASLNISGEGGRISADGEDLSQRIRSEAVATAASQVARHGAVRQAVLQHQRQACRPPGLVADGRDMGTVVFPQAALKIYLDAGPDARARRRHKQLRSTGLRVSLASVLARIRERDRRDSRRAASPLRPADDAVVIDSTSLTIEEVLQVALKLAEGRGLVAAKGLGSA